MKSRKRILTGDRPTGRLHLGHYVGSRANRVRLQDEYDCFFIIADLHVLQAADILLPRAHLVPVARDNEAHVEVAREVARRFNYLYGEVFPEPEALVGEVLVGTDGQAKASKSLGNVIYLSDDAETVREKVRRMVTDPQRIRADVPGRVEGNPVFIYHDFFNPNREEVEDLKARYRSGKVGDVEVKERLAAALNGFLEPIRERRACYEDRPGLVEEILAAGNERMRAEAEETMRLVREATGLTHLPSTNRNCSAYWFVNSTFVGLCALQ
ncbi:MAG: tryptophan--tRNA ligase [Anaerolineae bacterium]|jgi:tryptophanyl-tRNA synthetase